MTENSGNFTGRSTARYFFVFTFEENFSPQRARKWMQENQHHGFLFSGLYIFLIFSIQFYMRNKPRYELRISLALWNAALSIFSTIGAMRMVSELLHMVTNYSLYHSVCYPFALEPTNVTEFWSWLFSLSKLLELGDTMFIVLRKQPLIFLHWYHHVSVVLYNFTAYSEYLSYTRWFQAMNFSVHSFMYSYYFLRAIGFSVPKFIMMSITISQIVQMVIACVIISMGFYYRLDGQPCQISHWNIVLRSCMYVSYLILFSRLFCKMYLSPSKNEYSTVSHKISIKTK